jgi:hypothetical protein
MGRELDRKIAEAQGYTVHMLHCWHDPENGNLLIEHNQKDPTGNYYAGMHPCYIAGCICSFVEPLPEDSIVNGHFIGCYDVVPRYSTRIQDAWELNEEGWEWVFQESGGCLTVAISIPGQVWQSIVRVNWQDYAETYALARSRAYLKAKEAVGKGIRIFLKGVSDDQSK